jgi:arginine/serine-rich splicing factor 4/5/6
MPGQRLYIGNIPSDCREKDLERFFKGYGKIREIVLKNNYGFVELDSHRDADDAIHDLDGKDMMGGRIRVELAKDPRDRNRRDRDGGGRRDAGFARGGRDGGRGRPPGPKTNYRILVENISSRTSWQDLKDYFRSAGEITYANAHSPRSGDGVVEFANRRGMEYALDHKDDLELDGKKLKIRAESNNKSRSRSRSRSRSSHSRSRSRSRSSSRSRKRRSNRDKSKSHSRSRSKSRSKSPVKRSKTHSKSKSRSKSRSRSKD